MALSHFTRPRQQVSWHEIRTGTAVTGRKERMVWPNGEETPMNRLKDALARQLRLLAQGLEVPMADLAGRCAESWPGRHGLEQALAEGIYAIPHCHLVYALDIRGVQVSGNVTLQGVSGEGHGHDLSLSVSPYLRLGLHPETLKLFDVSIRTVTGRTCLTARRAVEVRGCVLGLLAADLDPGALSGLEPGALDGTRRPCLHQRGDTLAGQSK